MEEQPLDVKGALRAVKRYRALIALVMLVGLAAGVAYGIRTRPLPTARSLILLPPNAITGNPGVSPYTKTQEIIVSSSRVLLDASKAVYPQVSPSVLKEDLSVTAPSQDVLSITVRAKSSADAKRLADAVAASYIAYVDGVGSGTEQLLSQLHREADGLTTKILGLQHQIDAAESRVASEKAGSAARQRDSALLSALTTEQEQLSIQLNSVNGQVTNSELTAAQSASSTQLLQSAETIAVSQARLPLIALLGVLVGLIAGCVLAVGLATSDRRLRSRDAIATAIGIPVVASMWAKRCKKVSDWRRLLETSRGFSPLEIWNARRLFQRFITPRSSGVELELLAFSGDDGAAAAGVKMARVAAALGMNSQLEAADQPAFVSLRAAGVVISGPISENSIMELKVDSTAGTEMWGVGASLRLRAIDRGKPELGPASSMTLLIVSSGFATSAELARAALAATDAGRTVAGVIVANPDPDDHTSGLLPEASDHLRPKARSLNGHGAPELAGREPK